MLPLAVDCSFFLLRAIRLAEYATIYLSFLFSSLGLLYMVRFRTFLLEQVLTENSSFGEHLGALLLGMFLEKGLRAHRISID